MLVFAALMIAAAVVMGIYAAANGGAHDVSLFGQSWNVYDWVPPVIAAGVMGLLLLLCMVYAAARINRLRRGSVALKGEVARLQMELGLVREVRDREIEAATERPAPDRELVGREERLRANQGEFLREREPAGVAAADHGAVHRHTNDEAGISDTGDPRVHELPSHGYTADRAGSYTPLT